MPSGSVTPVRGLVPGAGRVETQNSQSRDICTAGGLRGRLPGDVLAMLTGECS